jgi:hypothetical protein
LTQRRGQHHREDQQEHQRRAELSEETDARPLPMPASAFRSCSVRAGGARLPPG